VRGVRSHSRVRTEPTSALYVPLTHNRGHLRDALNSFKVTLAVIADPRAASIRSHRSLRSVATLEAAKACCAQVCGFPGLCRRSLLRRRPFDSRPSRSEPKDRGLIDDAPVSEAAPPVGETDRWSQAQAAAAAARRPGEAAMARLFVTRATFLAFASVASGCGRDRGARIYEDEAEEQPGRAARRSVGRRERMPAFADVVAFGAYSVGPEIRLAGSIADERGPSRFRSDRAVA